MIECYQRPYPFQPDDPRFKGKLGPEALRILGITPDPERGEETHFIREKGGRQLAFEVDGDPNGYPVVLMHGTNGSRRGPKPSTRLLGELGVRLITPDRSGYGYSDPHSHNGQRRTRQPADSVHDTKTVLNYLGIKGSFSVVGRSAGGPHALACAAMLPGIDRAAALASMAPIELIGPEDAYKGMGPHNAEGLGRSEAKGIVHREHEAAGIRSDPKPWLDSLRRQDPAVDDYLSRHPEHERELLKAYQESLEFSTAGWHDDTIGNNGPWGFDPRKISTPVLLWSPGQDGYSPHKNGEWLANNIPTAQSVQTPEACHFSASFEAVPAVLGWCATGEYRPDLVEA